MGRPKQILPALETQADIIANTAGISPEQARLTTPATTPVITTPKPWNESVGVVLNGMLIIISILLEIFNLIVGASLLEPIIRVIVPDASAEAVALTVQRMTLLFSVIGLWLRNRTKEPVTYTPNAKE